MVDNEKYLLFQHAAARRRLTETEILASRADTVSTRSRPKAADQK